MDSPDLPAVFRIVSRETKEVVLLVDAVRVLWGVKIFMSTRACCSVVLIHREIVDLFTTLCGLEKLINRTVCFHPRGSVLMMYSAIVVTIHKSGVLRICCKFYFSLVSPRSGLFYG